MPQILIAEDEYRISSFLEKGLRAHGFVSTIAKDATEAIVLARCPQFDLMILDLSLPDKDGLDILRELRGQGEQLPIIILSARNDIHDKLQGLEGGADDYMTKPFRFEELLARIHLRMQPRQGASLQKEWILRSGMVELNLQTRTAKVGDRLVELPTREFALAETFLRHPNQLLSREQLLDRVWGYDYNPGSNVVDVYVGYLRKRLGNHLIETVRGVGYRLKS